MGEMLHPARISNPKGFFESPQINGINERILLPYLPHPFQQDGIAYGEDTPRRTHTWLARIPASVEIGIQDAERAEIGDLVSRRPFLFKDPRFAYTLPHWTSECRLDWKVICVFRHPSTAVESILTEVRTQPYLHDFALSVNQAFEHWHLIYTRLLSQYDPKRWTIVSYDRVLDGRALSGLQHFTSDELDRDFPAGNLNRTCTSLEAPAHCIALYDHLTALEE